MAPDKASPFAPLHKRRSSSDRISVTNFVVVFVTVTVWRMCSGLLLCCLT